MDIVGKETLEQMLLDYEGTVLFVSHDRYFINQTATRILDLVNKSLVNYIGNYDYYLDEKENLYYPYTIESITINRNDGSPIDINICNLNFDLGKYYYFNDMTNSFDIPPMESGN